VFTDSCINQLLMACPRKLVQSQQMSIKYQSSVIQGWTLNCKNTRHSGEWPSKCTRPDQFSLTQKFTPLPLPPLHSNHFSHLLFVRLITGSFRGFFLLFLFDYFGDSRNPFPRFFILYAISLRENTQWSESWESTENNWLKRRQARSWPRIISSMKNSI